MHRLVDELLAVVPPDGSAWPRPARERWVAAVAAVLDVIYEDERDPAVPRARGGHAASPAPRRAASPFVDGPPPGQPPATARVEQTVESESAADPGWYLDLRPEPAEAAASRGRHARQSAD